MKEIWAAEKSGDVASCGVGLLIFKVACACDVSWCWAQWGRWQALVGFIGWGGQWSDRAGHAENKLKDTEAIEGPAHAHVLQQKE